MVMVLALQTIPIISLLFIAFIRSNVYACIGVDYKQRGRLQHGIICRARKRQKNRIPKTDTEALPGANAGCNKAQLCLTDTKRCKKRVDGRRKG